eukprot:1137556-Pelagomonas_calceolata.AAC.2
MMPQSRMTSSYDAPVSAIRSLQGSSFTPVPICSLCMSVAVKFSSFHLSAAQDKHDACKDWGGLMVVETEEKVAGYFIPDDEVYLTTVNIDLMNLYSTGLSRYAQCGIKSCIREYSNAKCTVEPCQISSSSKYGCDQQWRVSRNCWHVMSVAHCSVKYISCWLLSCAANCIKSKCWTYDASESLTCVSRLLASSCEQEEASSHAVDCKGGVLWVCKACMTNAQGSSHETTHKASPVSEARIRKPSTEHQQTKQPVTPAKSLKSGLCGLGLGSSNNKVFPD